MISDEERRKVVKALREPSNLLDIHASLYNAFDTCAEAVVTTVPADYYKHNNRRLLNRLADLIDRPTCKLVEAWDGEREQHYLDCTACHFGRRAIEQDDAGGWYNARELWCNVEYDDLTHCPYCGAEVVRDGD